LVGATGTPTAAACRSIARPNVNKYFLTVEPGVDAAFVVALALLCDEILEQTKAAQKALK
jgi:hypothetical protein